VIYYFNSGAYTYEFDTKREAQLHAQKMANKTGKKIRVMGRGLEAPKAVSRQKPKPGAFRRNPRDRYPPATKSSMSKTKYTVYLKKTGQNTAHILYASTLAEARRIAEHNRHEFDTVRVAKATASGAYNSNPAALHGSVMARRHGGIATDLKRLAHDIRKTFKSATGRIKTKTRTRAPAQRAPVITHEPYSARVMIGNKAVIESFETKAQAQAFIKSAKSQGFGDAVLV